MKGEGRESRQGSEIITGGEGDRRYFSARWLLLIPSEVLQGGRMDTPHKVKTLQRGKEFVEMQLSDDGESHYCPLS